MFLNASFVSASCKSWSFGLHLAPCFIVFPKELPVLLLCHGVVNPFSVGKFVSAYGILWFSALLSLSA